MTSGDLQEEGIGAPVHAARTALHIFEHRVTRFHCDEKLVSEFTIGEYNGSHKRALKSGVELSMTTDPNAMFSVENLTQCRLKGKWVALVAYLLRDGRPQHYAELKRQIKGISQKMLTQTLRQLEEEGMVTRTVYPAVPPTVEYALTPRGQRLLEAFLEIAGENFSDEA